MPARSKKRRMRAGHKNTRIVIYEQDPTTDADTDGFIPEAEKELCRRWAELVPQRGRLQQLPNTTEANVSHVLRIDYDETTKTVTPTNWLEIVSTGERLNIAAAIDLDNLHRVLELECTERE